MQQGEGCCAVSGSKRGGAGEVGGEISSQNLHLQSLGSDLQNQHLVGAGKWVVWTLGWERGQAISSSHLVVTEGQVQRGVKRLGVCMSQPEN